MRRISGLILISLSLLIGSGCSRSTSLTEVKEDGSWHRTVKLFVAAQNPMSMGGDQGKPATEPKIEDVFVPPTGVGWKITRSKTKEGMLQLVAERDLKLGQASVNDLVVKGQLNNSVTVTQIAPGKFEYKETFHWTAKKQDLVANADPTFIAAVKDSLGEKLATKENIEFLEIGLAKAVFKMMFGPGDPMLGQLISQPDLAERRLKIRLAKAADELLVARFGDSLAGAERLAVIRKLVASLDSKQFVDPEKKADPSSGSSSSQLVSMFISVKLPGVAVESNGELDPLSGEVFWAMYPEAAQIEDVVLRAVCEVRN